MTGRNQWPMDQILNKCEPVTIDCSPWSPHFGSVKDGQGLRTTFSCVFEGF